jgi:ABC-type Fe3+/spermidine/putrescine transport system ATPase subunit
MEIIKLVNINKKYNRQILSNISLKIRENEIIGLIGPNGSGKTTLLRIIAGLEIPDNGELFINKKCVYSKNKFVPPEKRNIGFVFQDLGLWPHMTVKEHIMFVLEEKITDKYKRQEKIKEVLKSINLAGYLNSYPHQLSGGEKQRLAIARSLAQDSNILLLDEPFSNLDPLLKKELKKVLVNLQKKLKITIIYISQNPNEILDIANRIAIMNKGEIIQIGKIKEILRKPKNEFVKEFLKN